MRFRERDREMKEGTFDFEKSGRKPEYNRMVGRTTANSEYRPTNTTRAAKPESISRSKPATIRWGGQAPPLKDDLYNIPKKPSPKPPPPVHEEEEEGEEELQGWIPQMNTTSLLPDGGEPRWTSKTPSDDDGELELIKPPRRTDKPPRIVAHGMGPWNPKLDGKNNLYSREDGELDRWVNEANDEDLRAVGITSGASKEVPSAIETTPPPPPPSSSSFSSFSSSSSSISQNGFNNVSDEKKDGRGAFATGFQWGLTKKPPRELPSLTKTSEYLYGYSVSRLALREKRRKIHRLYIYQGLMRDRKSLDREVKLKRNAERLKVPVTGVADVSLLDAMSKGRPHNGFVLEVEPIHIPTIDYLGNVKDGQFNAPISESTKYVSLESKQKHRHPFVLVLDQLLDGGNFGAILRSAYFLGVDAVVISANNSTPATASTSKSSAGALEVVDLYHSQNLLKFITESRKRDWKFYGAMPNPTQSELKVSKRSKSTNWYDMEGLNDPLHFHPCALVMGNEAEGLRPTVQALMDGYVTIRAGEDTDDTIDSLNVGVAASILTHGFLNPSAKKERPEPARDRQTIKKMNRRDMQKAMAENTMFTMDDGKYEMPRYEGTTLVEGSGAGVDDEDTTSVESTTLITTEGDDATLKEENEDEDGDEVYANLVEEEEGNDDDDDEDEEDWLAEQQENIKSFDDDEESIRILEKEHGLTIKDGMVIPFAGEEEDEDGDLMDFDEILEDDEDPVEDSEVEDSDDEDIEEGLNEDEDLEDQSEDDDMINPESEFKPKGRQEEAMSQDGKVNHNMLKRNLLANATRGLGKLYAEAMAEVAKNTPTDGISTSNHINALPKRGQDRAQDMLDRAARRKAKKRRYKDERKGMNKKERKALKKQKKRERIALRKEVRDSKTKTIAALHKRKDPPTLQGAGGEAP
ncbi:hypothetical protein AA313_de0203619 [Arthrobotrys entomopaga]|nr:hypothetical protein AA313_de0203619 [Arthrobotrys entomopaga]